VEMKKQKISEMVIGLLCIEGLVDRIRNIKVYANALSLKNFTGFLAMVLAVLLFLSGAFMAFYYTPAPGVSYDSVDFAMFDLPFGEIIKGIHHYSWNFLLLVMGVHLIRSFILGTNFSGDTFVHHHWGPTTMGPTRFLVHEGAPEYYWIGSRARGFFRKTSPRWALNRDCCPDTLLCAPYSLST